MAVAAGVSDRMGTMTEKFAARLRAVEENETLREALRILSAAGVCVSVYAFFYFVVTGVSADLWRTVKLVGCMAAGFVLVSILRRVLNFARPYEAVDFYPVPPKKRGGRAFPSRHAYSAAVIGTVLLFFSPMLGGITLGMGLLMSLSRVYLGLHFPRDAVAGTLIGISAGILGMLVLRF